MVVLAHLSDPHLGPLPKPRLAELAGKRATGYLNWRRKRQSVHRADVLARIVADLKTQAPDHIAVTGDLVNISLPGEYAPARAWLEALGPPHDVTLVPGNHDVYVRKAASAPAAHWGDYMRGDRHPEERAQRASKGDASSFEAGLRPAPQDDDLKFPFLRRRGPVALIGLSSAVPTAPLMATGRLGSEQILHLADMLDGCAREGLFRIVLIHHPPVSTPSRRFKRLVDGPALCETLARHGAELVIHGHDHERSLIHVAGPRGPIPVAGVPSASEAPPGEHDPAGYNLYRVEQAGGAWRCELRSRGMARDGETITEIARTVLLGDEGR